MGRIAPSDWEMFQSFLMSWFNKVVTADFREDIDIDSETEVNNFPNWTNEQQMKYLCQVKDSDSINLALFRFLLFNFIRNNVAEDTVYGMPEIMFQREVKTLPQIQLRFREKPSDKRARDARNSYSAQISIRLDERSDELLPSQVKLLIDRIIQQFLTPYYGLKKGRLFYSYYDSDRGYRLKVLSPSITEAKEVIGKVLAIKGDTPDWSILGQNEKPDFNYVTTGSQMILGDRVDNPHPRPICTVWLREVILFAHPAQARRILRVNTNGTFVRDY